MAKLQPLPPALTNPQFPAELPIAARIGEIVRLLGRHRTLIVAGETGSGKTTQIPKACLAAGLGRRGMIAHTQPRRLAARAVSARIAEELGARLGGEVGYAVRFSDRVSDATVVKVMTDGLLLAELRRDRLLRRYECVIVDEAHERSLNVDFILGCLKRLLAQRRDLRVVVTSATIDVARFAEYLGGAPVVEASGRGHPVEVVYRPVEGTAESALIDCLAVIAKEAPAGRRDILVFQSGEREIFENAQVLRRAFAQRFDILPLYARLPATEQRRVFAPGGRQRVVLATNVAETSLTVPNIGYVVDPGFARVSRYSYRAKLQRLPIEPIAQANAAQRAGRCGRVAPGVCYRLYDKGDLDARPAYLDPELKRTNLASVVLTMRAFRLGDVETFPFLDPPDRRAVRDATQLLHELQALRDDRLTEIGRTMARLPVDPRLARMIVAGSRNGALAEALVIASALAVQDPRLRPPDRREAADRAHALFADSAPTPGGSRPSRNPKPGRSDFLAFLNLWRWLEETRASATRSGFRRILEKRFLSPARVREWHAVHRQLVLACRDQGLKINAQAADYATLHRALLAGSLGFIGQRRDPAEQRRASAAEAGGSGKRRRVEYDGARGLRFRLWPGSALARQPPAWLVAAEIADGGETFARCAAAVAPEWIEEAARHLAKSSFSEPRWDAARGEAIVDERVTLYGLALVPRRPRRAAEVDAATAREIFVAEALVRPNEQGKRIRAAFLDHNQRLIDQVKEREARGRRADLLASEKARADFYLARLPAEVCSIAEWERYARQCGAEDLAAFEMTERDVLAADAPPPGADDFPMRLRCGEATLPLAYRFAPGEPGDGVTARVAIGQLAQLDADALEWLVPGLLEEKCLALVRALPKSLRRRLAPAAQRVRAVLPALLARKAYRRGKLAVALSDALYAEAGVRVPAAEWRLDALPAHLRMNVQVRGARRRPLDQDRDLAALRGRLQAAVENAIGADARQEHQRLGLQAFPEQGVTQTLTVRSGGAGRAVVHPVLVDRGDGVDLLTHATPQGQAELNRAGYARLALLAQAPSARRLGRAIERDLPLAQRYAPLGGIAELADALLLAGAWAAYFDGRELPETRAAFDACLAAGKLAEAVGDLLQSARATLAKRFEVARALGGLDSPAFAASRADLEAQLEALVRPRFPWTTPKDRVADLPRYLDGMAYRIAKLPGNVKRDQAGMAALAPWLARLAALRAAPDANAKAAAVELRFAVEEFRIATFSQPIGTRGKASAKRLAAAFEAAENAAGLR